MSNDSIYDWGIFNNVNGQKVYVDKKYMVFITDLIHFTDEASVPILAQDESQSNLEESELKNTNKGI